MHNKSLGLIEFGQIAKQVANICKKAFDIEVMFYDPNVSEELTVKMNIHKVGSIDDLLHNKDLISIHIPLNENTKHLIGQKQFNIMKRVSPQKFYDKGGRCK